MRRLWATIRPGTNGPSEGHSARWIAGITILAFTSLFVGTLPSPAQVENAGSATASAAQQQEATGTAKTAQANEEGPQNVRVVRLSDVEGMVQIQRGNEVQFSQAVMNMPLIQGSCISTGADGRAEVEFEDGSVVRMTPNSSIVLSRLEAATNGNLTTTAEQLGGLVYYELRSDPRSAYEVMLGDRTIKPSVNSTFRVNMATGTPDVSVIDGGVQVNGPSDSYQAEVGAGKAIEFPPSGNEKYTIANGILPNGFDEWNDQRDQQAQQQAQNQTPAREQGGGSVMDGGLGWSDLDSYGGWYPLPGYGMVWQPYGVGADFDPYGNGMWANFGGAFGYTWVSGYPWGWLPFHCGGWSYVGGFGWGWMPGPYGCGGVGIGYGWYGYGRWRNYRYPRTNIYGAPGGYHAPAPPNVAKGQLPPRIVRVGRGPMVANATLRSNHGGDVHEANRVTKFNGQKIAPLHSIMTGVHVPMRNAALYNNYPAHAFQGNVRDALRSRPVGETQRGGSMHPGGNGANMRAPTNAARTNSRTGFQSHRGAPERATTPGMFRSPMSASRMQAFNAARAEQHSFGEANRSGFGQHNSFGPRGGMNNAYFSGNGGGYRGGGGYHGGGPAGGGYRGGGGFHGGGVSSGGHAGGGMSSGGGMSGGGGFHGGGGVSGSGGGHSGC